ncbi:hypothetical protein K2P47_03520 [Patescibacteria group bacterium]|nr:hypothetical protein [Patescibacteria group bacterium]
MKRFSEQLKKKSETIRLRASEKAELQSRIVAFMEYHPLPATVKSVPVPKSKVVLEPYRLIAIPRAYVRSFVGVTALLFIVVIPTMAESAIPGDILYPVKVNFTEEIRSTLSTNSYEKVVWETTRLERRISEARLLAQAGKLTGATEAEVLAAVQVHSDKAKQQIESLRTTDADGAALAQMTFATMLDVQSSVLKSDDSASTTEGKSTVALASVLDAGYTEASSDSSVDAVSVVRLLAQLEVETTRSYELLSSISDSATEQEQTDVRRRLADLESKIKTATDDTSADTELVKKELRNAWTDIQKLISYMTDIDVRNSLTVEKLVPAVLSDAEKLAQSIQKYELANTQLQRIKFGAPLITEQDIVAKIEPTIPKVADLLTIATTSMYVNIDEAKVAVDEALALTESMLTLYQFPELVEMPRTDEVAATTTIPVDDTEGSTTASTSTETTE